jgi:hypothetical protein
MALLAGHGWTNHVRTVSTTELPANTLRDPIFNNTFTIKSLLCWSLGGPPISPSVSLLSS